jgi:hypothetical protein
MDKNIQKEKLTRRRFLKRTLMGSGALFVSQFVPIGCSTKEAPFNIKLEFFTPEEFTVMQAIAGRIIVKITPDDVDSDDVQLANQIDKFLYTLDPEIQAQFKQLLVVFNSALFAFIFDFKFSSFTDMTTEEQDKYLEDWMTSKYTFRRTAFQGLKRLCMNIFYADSRSWKAIKYEGPAL